MPGRAVLPLPTPPLFYYPHSRMLARAISRTLSSSKPTPFLSTTAFPRRTLSSATPYPLYYELINHRPPPRHRRRQQQQQQPDKNSALQPVLAAQQDGIKEEEEGGEELETQMPGDPRMGMDKSKRKYYRKRSKRMYGGSDSDDGANSEEVIELKPEVIDFPRLHAREEELYFYDAFAFPWEKNKHYRMVYQLEKKYFPDQCLDKAFADPGQEQVRVDEEKGKKPRVCRKDIEKSDDKGLIFFEEGEKDEKVAPAAVVNVSEKKVEEFFKCLKKVPSVGSSSSKPVSTPAEPFLASRKTGLPPRWDGPSGNVVLINKPKGWTSFTVCGKLRRLVKVQKVGHAGTLDPMATGLLIVCVGKATKLMERYQDMIKGYSGVFRLGEATSTWDADSPVIQREPWEHIKDDDIKRTAATFRGEIWQVPPMFSAIKLGGEKMYEKARRGEMVELSPRRISIFQFDIERSLDDRQNLIFRVTCSKGTYIRSLCADFGKALGSCAHLTALRRDLIGQYSADDAWDFKELQDEITKGYL